MSNTDRIEKQVELRAPRERVWRALTDSRAFGTWFGMTLEGEFRPHSKISGAIVPTQVDAEVAAAQAPYVGMACDLWVERIEPMHTFSFRWHPGASPDAANGPTTLVEFTLQPTAQGTLLRIVESGFDAIPIERRAKAFADNEGGWSMQLQLIAKYLQRDAG